MFCYLAMSTLQEWECSLLKWFQKHVQSQLTELIRKMHGLCDMHRTIVREAKIASTWLKNVSQKLCIFCSTVHWSAVVHMSTKQRTMFRASSIRCFNCTWDCASWDKINMQWANCSRNRKLLWQFLMFLKRVQKVQKQHYKQWSRWRHVEKPEPFWLLTMTWNVCQNASKFEKCEAVQMTLNVHVDWPKNAKNAKLSKWLKTSV